MAVKLNFDTAWNVEYPTFVICARSGERIAPLTEVQELKFTDDMMNPSEFYCKIYRNNPSWDYLNNYRLLWIPEWDKYYSITLQDDEGSETVKQITATHLAEKKFADIRITDEINTEDDIARVEYVEPTVFFNERNPEASLLHRITRRTVPFTFKHIDPSLAGIQRMFSFNDIPVRDAFNEIAEEINCVFEYDTYTGANNEICIALSAYDLESNCQECGYRGEFSGACPKCGSSNVTYGYGEDTTVFISRENLADDITFETDMDSVKNCFKLETGDDLMTAYVQACNPNGTQYIWYISDEVRKNMSPELVARIEEYDRIFDNYYNSYVYPIDVSAYNALAKKYELYKDAPRVAPAQTVGYPQFMEVYFDAIDMELFLKTVLMPTPSISDTTAQEQGGILMREITSVAINTTTDNISKSSADNAVLGMARAIIDSRYSVKLSNTSLSGHSWSGCFVVENYSDETDTYTTASTSIAVNTEYLEFIHQKIDKVLAKGDDEDYGIVALFHKDIADFKVELQKYGLDSLNRFMSCCQGALDVLIEQGVANESYDKQLYDQIYTPYLAKLTAIQAEMKAREDEANTIVALEEEIDEIRFEVQMELDFRDFLGETLWKEFTMYQMEDTYSNSNYISDGLDNAQAFRNAQQFLETANRELIKSATLQHSISATLKNLLIMKEFQPMHDKFATGNWIRIEVDGKIYRLRLLSYTINFDDYSNIDVTFSDVVRVGDDVTDLESILSSARSMASSYGYVERQAEKGSTGYSVVDGWATRGMDLTLTRIINSADNEDVVVDEHGILCRKWNDIMEAYDPEQTKIVSGTIAITGDGWETVKTALGRFYYFDPVEKVYKTAYGVNGEVIVGTLLLGEQLGIYNSGGSLSFDKNGLTITNGTNTFKVNPNSNTLLSISNKTRDLLWVNDQGSLNMYGAITATEGFIGGGDGFHIASGKLYSGSHSTYNAANNGVYIGTDYIALGANGVVYFKNDGTFKLGTGNNTITYNDGALTFGSGVSLSWSQVTGTGNVASKSDIPTDAHITQITKNTVTTAYVNALKVTAEHVAAENITGTTITGKTLSGCTGSFSGSVTATSGYIGGKNGFTITTGKMYSGSHSEYNSSSDGVYIGTDYIALGAYGRTWFKSDGTFNLNNGSITYDGDTTSFSGTVETNALYINGNKIYCERGSFSYQGPGSSVINTYSRTDIMQMALDPTGDVIVEEGQVADLWMDRMLVLDTMNGVRIKGGALGGMSTVSTVDLWVSGIARISKIVTTAIDTNVYYEKGVSLASRYAAIGHTHSQYVTSNTVASLKCIKLSNSGISYIDFHYDNSSSTTQRITTAGQEALTIFPNKALNDGITIGSWALKDGVFPRTDGWVLGGSSHRWDAVYAVNGSIQTSDERDKNIIGTLDNPAYKRVYMSLKPILYKWKERGLDPNKVHIGLGAQTVEKRFKENGFNPDEVGMIQHDYWERETSDPNERTDRYGFNYAEVAVWTVPIVQDHEITIQLLKAQIEYLTQTIQELKNNNYNAA